MGKFIDLTGQKFGRLTVIKQVKNDNSNHINWLCKCDCGNEKTMRGDHLTRNIVKSCGCYNREISKIKAIKMGKNSKKHGLSNNRLYRIWAGMKSRCYNYDMENFDLYGGRGIKVCSEWLDKNNGFMNFYNWATKNGYQENLTLDRIDTNGNYEPSNCRWATWEEQANNKRSNHYITYNGKTQTLSQWSRELNIKRDVLYDRIDRLNWDIEKALSTPVRFKRG
jgi:hypothetical protein